MSGLVLPAALAATLLTASCAPPRVVLPSGAGRPFPEFAAAYADATRDCRGVRTLSVSLSLSGRAAGTKLSARIDAGFAETGRLRLEGYPRVNFGGRPFFILAASGADTTLVLTRDDRVLRGAPPSAIIEALAGIALEPEELRALASGCALGAGDPDGGRSFDRGWAAGDVADTTVFLQQVEGHWRVAGARRRSLTVEYVSFAGGRPAAMHLQAAPGPGAAGADLTLRLSQVEINPPLDDAVFRVDVPRDAVPMTLEELRRAGPLGGTEETEETQETQRTEETEGTEGTGRDQRGGTEGRGHGGGAAGLPILRGRFRA